MKVLLHSDMLKSIERSGVGRAIEHQMMALESEGIDYTLDPKDDYDVLHINTIFPQSYFKADQALKEGKAVVYHAHSTEEDFRDSFILSNAISSAFRVWIKKCYSKSDLIITPTNYSKKLLENYALSRPIEVVSNGIDLDYWRATPEETRDFREEYGLTSEDKVVIAVGHYIKRKGIIDFVELARRMPEYTFIWFGYTDPKIIPEEIREAIETKLPNLIFAGYVDRSVLRVAYAACDLYLFPTYEETEGIVLLEALASKSNILVRDIPIYKDSLKDGKNIYKATTNDEFEEKIRGIVEGRLSSLVEEGYKVAQSRSIEHVGKRLRECYTLALNYRDRYLYESQAM